MGHMYQDLAYTRRQLLKTPGTTALVVLVLALGIGANTAIFSMVYGVVFSPLPYADGDRLVQLHQTKPETGLRDPLFSVQEIADYRTQSRSFAGVVEYHGMSFTLLGKDKPQRVQTGVVSANFFDVLGTRPLLGRSFMLSDEIAGAEPVLILSHGYWQREYGGDVSIIGRNFEMNDKIHTVVGVLPPVPQYPDDNDVYMPTSACPFRADEKFQANRKLRLMQVFARLQPGVAYEQAEADLRTIAGRLFGELPEVYDRGGGYGAGLTPLREVMIGEARGSFMLLLATVALVLLITCVNLANLTFARLTRRGKEMAIRTVLGAARRRLVRQLVTESVVLSLLGGILGLAFAYSGLGLLTASAARFTPRADEISIDAVTLLFTLGLSLATGLAFGVVPAFSASGDALLPLREGGGRATTSSAMKRLRNGLIVVELAVSFVLLVGAGLMIRSLANIRSVDTGFDAENVLTARISVNWSNYDTKELRAAFFTSLLEKVRSIPGVVESSLAMRVPLDESSALPSTQFEVEGQVTDRNEPPSRASFEIISPRYFASVGIPILSGRDFDARDLPDAEPVAILSQSVVRRYWADQDPIGRRYSHNGGKTWITVVGVVGDARLRRLATVEETHMIYRPLSQASRVEVTLFVKSTADPMSLARPVREAVFDLDPNQAVSKVRTLEQMWHEWMASPRLTAILLSLFAGLALLIATVGLGGVIAFTVSQQTQEIGVRMALGAPRSVLLWTLLRNALTLIAAGLSLGAVGGWFLSEMMAGLVFQVPTRDLPTFVGVALVLAVVAGVSCLLPARRATRIDPVTALRFEL